ncbi:MAG TPA: hypothetical protein EYH09_01275 [Candidatus Nanopusillus sp.]|nr:hypothetical protein [Candidatus Nanopusillus sp.]HIP90006.1 hypothetical protein [Candidatus Nanopusillus sp.]
MVSKETLVEYTIIMRVVTIVHNFLLKVFENMIETTFHINVRNFGNISVSKDVRINSIIKVFAIFVIN